MWCEEFVSGYRSTPVDRLSEYYGNLSVFVETTDDGRWTEPATGAYCIVNRLATLNLTGVDGWPVEICQRTRDDGLLVVLMAPADRTRRQILIVHQSVVSNHFYLTTADNALDTGSDTSFRKRFEDWATSLDKTSIERHRTAFQIGLTVARNFYASPAGRPGNRARWRQYDREAKFSCTRNGHGGDRVYAGLRPIRKRYGRLALDYRYAKLRAVETCWYVTPVGDQKRAPHTTMVLAMGTVPEMLGPGNRAHREFVQFFVIDTCAMKILNDVLCFEVPRGGMSPDDDFTSCSLSSSTTSSSSSSVPSSSLLSSPLWSVTSLSDDCSSSTSVADGGRSGVEEECRSTADDLATFRSRLTVNALKTRCIMIKMIGEQQQNVIKLNPRQLFIGCVPLHVKYGQLKLLFERFGEVTYVKVYEGYNKQTGVKMSHNYAFLFFKEEVSVSRAIAASPVPLDSNWNLNVSRPHHHTTTVASGGDQ